MVLVKDFRKSCNNVCGAFRAAYNLVFCEFGEACERMSSLVLFPTQFRFPVSGRRF